jgi:hypothetical protein
MRQQRLHEVASLLAAAVLVPWSLEVVIPPLARIYGMWVVFGHLALKPLDFTNTNAPASEIRHPKCAPARADAHDERKFSSISFVFNKSSAQMSGFGHAFTATEQEIGFVRHFFWNGLFLLHPDAISFSTLKHTIFEWQAFLNCKIFRISETLET